MTKLHRESQVMLGEGEEGREMTKLYRQSQSKNIEVITVSSFFLHVC